VTGNQKMVPLPPKPPRKSDLVLLKELLEQDKVAPVLDRHYTLRELTDALWHLAKGHARGRIVITG
jgi:NADPH:quinone reductase-like Zn-dependent oxidoreductase